MAVTHQGEVFATMLPRNPSATEEDADFAQRPDITFTAGLGHGWDDVTGCPGRQLLDTPNFSVYLVMADEAFFLGLGDDVIWYEEIQNEVPQ
jgi:hypothetical protein